MCDEAKVGNKIIPFASFYSRQALMCFARCFISGFTQLTGKRRNVPDLGGTVLEEFDNLVESSLVVGRNRELAKTVNRLLRIHKDQSIFFAMGVGKLYVPVRSRWCDIFMQVRNTISRRLPYWYLHVKCNKDSAP